MRTDDTSLSVIIPVYNGELYLAEAIESVLRQEYKPIEIIVVNDGSKDRSAQIAEDFAGVTVIHQSHSGLPRTRNRGLEAAAGNLITILDSDDLIPAGSLSRLVDTIRLDPTIEVITGKTQLFRTATRGEEGELELEKITNPVVTFTFGGSVIRRNVFNRVGYFSEYYPFCDDIDWFMRAREANVNIAFFREVTLYYRRHGANMTLDREADFRGFMKAFKDSLDRRRAKGGGRAYSLPSLKFLFDVDVEKNGG